MAVTGRRPGAGASVTRRHTILVDCDGVLADFVGAVLDGYNHHAGTRWTDADVHRFEIAESIGVAKDVLYAQVTASFCLGIHPIDGAREAVERMREVADVVCVTATWDRVPSWDDERREWLAREMGFCKDDVIFAKGARKPLVRGDLFFDDLWATVANWRAANRGGKGVLVRQPWNEADVTDDYVVGPAAMATVARVYLTGQD